MVRVKDEVEQTDNSSVYEKAIKEYRAHTGEIKCSYCKYHRKENDTRRGKKKKLFKKERE